MAAGGVFGLQDLVTAMLNLVQSINLIGVNLNVALTPLTDPNGTNT